MWFNGVRDLTISPKPFENAPAITDDNAILGDYDADGNTNWAGNTGVIWRRSC